MNGWEKKQNKCVYVCIYTHTCIYVYICMYAVISIWVVVKIGGQEYHPNLV